MKEIPSLAGVRAGRELAGHARGRIDSRSCGQLEVLTAPSPPGMESWYPMAQRTQVVLTDDIDGSEADTTIRFAVNGTAREIDLNAAPAAEFRKAVQPFIAAARKTGGGASRRAGTSRGSSRPSGPSPSDVRAWARGQGIKVKDKGRVPDELIVRFQAADQ